MQLLTDDASFGFLVSFTSTPRFFVFSLSIQGETLGTGDSDMAATALGPLAQIACLADRRLAPAASSPSEVEALLASDDDLSDATLRHLCESLDAWKIRLFEMDGQVNVVATPIGGIQSLRAVVPCREFTALCDALATIVSGGSV